MENQRGILEIILPIIKSQGVTWWRRTKCVCWISPPNVALTTDGKGKPYRHGEVTKAVAGISLTDSLEGEIQAEDVGEVDVQALELFSNEELETVFSQNKEEETDDV